MKTYHQCSNIQCTFTGSRVDEISLTCQKLARINDKLMDVLPARYKESLTLKRSEKAMPVRIETEVIGWAMNISGCVCVAIGFHHMTSTYGLYPKWFEPFYLAGNIISIPWLRISPLYLLRAWKIIWGLLSF